MALKVSSNTMFSPNQQIGNYTLVKRIGRGGFGEVWLAERRTALLTTRVAVKLPHREQVDLEAIRQEAELWAKASGHANILPIIEANIYDGQIVIVSEYAPDGSLEEMLHAEIPVKRTLEIVAGILNGLEFLHSRQIIHRDIKPANVLLQGETPRLADFGISRVIKTTVLSTTIIGTPKYMAPETFDGKRSAQTDIWSVGVILYQMLAGNVPFTQENPTELMWAVVTKEPAPMPEDVPSELRRIVRKALAKLPENRFQTAREMREELQRALLNISHPTFAPTEVLSNSAEILNDAKAIEERSVVTKFSAYEVPPTEQAVPVDNPSVATRFIPPTVLTNEPPVVYPEFQLTPKAVPETEESTTQPTLHWGLRWGFIISASVIGFLFDRVIFMLADELMANSNFFTLNYPLLIALITPFEIVIFGLLGALFGYLLPQEKWHWGLWLNSFVLLYFFQSFFRQLSYFSPLLAVLFLFNVFSTLLVSCLASHLGARRALRQNNALNS